MEDPIWLDTGYYVCAHRAKNSSVEIGPSDQIDRIYIYVEGTLSWELTAIFQIGFSFNVKSFLQRFFVCFALTIQSEMIVFVQQFQFRWFQIEIELNNDGFQLHNFFFNSVISVNALNVEDPSFDCSERCYRWYT